DKANYYKIYHYSAKESLTSIDPHYFGTGICYAQLKRGALGINKSYYFVSAEDNLPAVSKRPVKYEMYMPCGWKIYDIEKDPDRFYEKARRQLRAENKYEYD